MPTPITKSMSLPEWGMLVFLSVLWGGSFLFVAVAVKQVPTLTVVLLRVGLAALVLHLVLLVLGVRLPRDGKIWRAFLVMGTLNNLVPFTLIAWGQIHIASGLASILNATTPLFTVVLAHYWTSDERMTVSRMLGVLVGFGGVVLMIGPAALADIGVDVFAQLACLAAAVSYAVAGLYGRRFVRDGVEPLVTATGQVTASAVLLLPVVALADRPWTLTSPDAPVWAAIIALAVLSTALAYVVYFRLLATAGATNLLLVTFLIPVTAIILGALVLGERLESRQVIGMILIGIGLTAIDGRIVRARHRWLRTRRGAS